MWTCFMELYLNMAFVGLKKAMFWAFILQISCTSVWTRQFTCDVCDRRPTSCRRIAGLYTVTVLTKGTYNPVVEIPARACSINITELAPSQNYLAVRTNAGDNVVNGYWSIGSTGSFHGVGTVFEYNRGVANCPGQCIYAQGPTEKGTVVQLLYYSKNPGIAYAFVLPNEVPFQPFDEVAPKVEARTQTQNHRSGGHHRHHQDQRQRPGPDAAGEPYDPNYAEKGHDVISPVEEPSRSHAVSKTMYGSDRNSETAQGHTNYTGASYGSHTLGGRGLSYTFPYESETNPESKRENTARTRGSEAERPSSENTRTYTRRPYSSPKHIPPPRQHPPPTHLSAYDSDGSRGHDTLALGSSRAGLVDRTYSRTLEQENRLQTFERPVVDQRPTLSIGVGGGGNEYEWVISPGFTDCSLSCGEGVQETRVVCVRTSGGTQVVVTEDNCQNALKPRTQRVSCNKEPCPPGWVSREWSACSATCGSGTQARRVECKQRISDTLEFSVSASQCDQSLKPAIIQQCETDPCVQWREDQWGPCSTDCGGGIRQRKVECVDTQGVQIPDSYCPLSSKPMETEICNVQMCNTQWWSTAWSEQCSAECGSGVTTRNVLCADRDGRPVQESSCDVSKKPRDRKRCESSTGCGNVWFSSPWSQCSEDCGQGVRARQVVCLQKEGDRAALTVAVSDEKCRGQEKPATEEVCYSTSCGAQYYMTDWSQCSVTCGNGVRIRVVKCMDDTQRLSRACDLANQPPDRDKCQMVPCREVEQEKLHRNSTEEGHCRNTFLNCRMVVQARLCSYHYYKRVCCAACQHHHPSH